MRFNKSLVGGFLLGLGIPVAMIVGLLVAPASNAATTYTAADVATHSSQTDCWVAINTNVYNLTSFAPKHSGGSARIYAVCGKDGTSTFVGQHGQSASKLTTLSAYLVGTYSAPIAATPTPTPTTPATAGNSYTLAQVSAHGTSSDCWSAVNNNVYNLTSWIPSHPGGRTVIIQMCGLDGSGYYNGQHGGSSEVASTLRRFLIGSLAPTPTPTATASYTFAQVATHKTQTDCWTAINGKVYDLTAFVTKHPGGTTQIIGLCGTDGTGAFTGKHSGSPSANSTLGIYLIGNLTGGVPTPAPTTPGPTTAYTLAQVATHNTAANCWVIISTTVYDLTTFAPIHSGTAARITPLCGKDGTSTFTGQHASTSAAKLTILAAYRVGVYSASGTPAVTGSYTLAQVAAHGKTTDCWVALVGNVYDLTSWKATHSGGQSIIDGVCGTDGTATFYGKHASVASTKLAILDAYRIGVQSDYVPTTLPAPVTIDALVGGGQYTMDDVKKHSTAADCWTVIGDGVYGLSTWIPVHPGGASVVTALCGIDGTAMYSGKHGGSASAGAILSKIRIGTLVASTAKPVVTYTADDVAKHSTESDCWSIVNGNVYDLTAWIPKHPGGKAVIIAMCGSDGTAMFTGKHGGNAGALAALNGYKIGALAAAGGTGVTISGSGAIVTLIPAKKVIAHRTAFDCWSIVNHNVYNLTPWTKHHQSRKAFIKVMCGKNGSAAFNEATGSAAKSSKKLKRFLIGRVGRPAATAAGSGATGTYTLADLAAHKTASSCWAAVNGGVYDLTKWIPLHPGGASAISGMCGKDGSASYNAMHKGSAKAAAALALYSIGKLG